MGTWNQPITIAAAGLNADIGGSNGLHPGLYLAKIVDVDLEAGKPGKSPNLIVRVETTAQKGTDASPTGSKDNIYISTDQTEEINRRRQKALALAVGYSEQEVEAPTFVLLPARVIGQTVAVFAQQDGVNDKGYPNVNRNIITRPRFDKLKAEIDAGGGKVPFGPLGKDGSKTPVASANAGGAGAAPSFGAPAGAPTAPSFGAAPTQVPTNGAPAAGFVPPAPATPDLGAMSQSLKM